MTRQLHIAGKNSNEIYTLVYPNNLTTFCKYDFTPFLNHCTDLCRLANRTGEYSVEDVYAIRNSISGCHKYYEQNMRTIFEKIVIDCWIDYLCHQSEATPPALWQSFMRCKNDFERAVFTRLSEYRYNRAVNEWVNLIKLQEYARKKTDFIFGVPLSGAVEAGSRANYFDLMFNVAANEQGFAVEEIGASSVYSAGRVPNSPFILSSASREILRNVLGDMEEAASRPKKRLNPELSDQLAMDAFSVIKQYIPDKNDSLVNTIIKAMRGSPQRVYLPRSFKSMIDLEIDALIGSGGILQRCPRCGEYYLKDEEYPYDYCNRTQKDGLTCLEAAEREHIEVKTRPEPIETEPPKVISQKPLEKAYVNEKMETLYKEMAARVNVDLTQRDFSRWYQRELQLKELILLGQAGEKELEDFIELSRGDEFASRKQPPLFEKHNPDDEPIAVTESGKEVKRFVFERVDRLADAPKSPETPKASLAAYEQAANEAVQRLFAARGQQTAPQASAQSRQYPAAAQPYGYSKPIYPSQQPKPVTRIIRGGAANAGYTERPFDAFPKPKTVVIPNGEDRPAAAPVRERPPEDADIKLYRDEDDVKVFTPRRAKPSEAEATPYREKIRQPLEEYRRDRAEAKPSAFNEYIEPSRYEEGGDEARKTAESREEVQISGQMSTEEVTPAAPAPSQKPAASAKALSAYRTHSAPTAETEEKKLEKADFAGILENMNRNDGFKSEEVELDSDGLPVSHKTQHVMNALFGSSRISPFLKVNLDDEDE
ncbi:MAG: DUF6076 domain-containing protein [Bacteroides sp.]|nr:DUF6076 domain-containing protein [Eubacterium sp.]MCM1417693.1 DUF6076 domain-containing protein [Roseburia sp.]MCM1461841.1 DUF6076 domain-containing protein [Bacteroides sp.]